MGKEEKKKKKTTRMLSIRRRFRDLSFVFFFKVVVTRMTKTREDRETVPFATAVTTTTTTDLTKPDSDHPPHPQHPPKSTDRHTHTHTSKPNTQNNNPIHILSSHYSLPRSKYEKYESRGEFYFGCCFRLRVCDFSLS
jgi:hypothetical protein